MHWDSHIIDCLSASEKTLKDMGKYIYAPYETTKIDVITTTKQSTEIVCILHNDAKYQCV